MLSTLSTAILYLQTALIASGISVEVAHAFIILLYYQLGGAVLNSTFRQLMHWIKYLRS